MENEHNFAEEIIIPDSFESIGEFETFVHNELCIREEIWLGELLGIFSYTGKFLKKIYIQTQIIGHDLFMEYRLTDEDISLIRGNLISHNHPSNSSFSYNEILSAADLNVIESRIITLNWIYSIKPLNNTWPSIETISRVNEEIDSDPEVPYYILDYNSNPEWKHERYEILSQRAGFNYYRRPWRNGPANIENP